jgi:hypothetical protein
MPSFLLMFLKAKLVAHLFLIRLVCAYPLGLLRDYSTFTVHRNFKMFLLPMQSVGASTSLIQIVFGSLMSVGFLNKIIVLFPCIIFSLLIVSYHILFCFKF